LTVATSKDGKPASCATTIAAAPAMHNTSINFVIRVSQDF
jgi:hypothetical protein